MNTQGNRLYFPLIDLLRACAALLVIVYHVIVIGEWTSFPVEGWWFLLFRVGWIGVDLFFVISGFVIALTALAAYDRSGSHFMPEYFKRRWLRIAPLYFCTLLIYLFLVDPSLLMLGYKSAMLHIVSHLLFIHNLLPTTHGSINGPNWSVALEMQFYVMIALLTPWLSRVSPIRLILLFISIAIGYRYCTTLLLPPGSASTLSQHVYSTLLPGTLDAFGSGIVLAILITRAKYSKAAGFLSPSWRNAACWGGISLVMIYPTWTIFWSTADYWSSTLMISLWKTALALSFTSVLALSMTLPIQRLTLLQPALYLGRISYGLYLWHLPVLHSLLQLDWPDKRGLLAMTLTCTIILSAASWHFFEKLFLKDKPTKHDQNELKQSNAAGTAMKKPDDHASAVGKGAT
ncbi:acyltransferase family protein [Nitrincola alkalilacustris]|uniref:acyltransferase family protein n=1 Tax=Nitrincola alkalilacustris TaxID=1571224 RepID=UPI00124C1A5E|nr:acyltransferase [Nitrincola alkalilacustris]